MNMSDDKNPGDFKQATIKHGIKTWDIHNCSFCNYTVGFLFKGDLVFYDNGCDCTNHLGGMRHSSFKEVARHYNMQSSDVKKRYNSFWKFT